MMPCLYGENIVVCRPTITAVKKWRRICPSCTFRATHLGWHQQW